MANYICVQRSNYFRVTNEERLDELLGNLVGEDRIEHWTTASHDGSTLHAFGTYGNIDYCPGGYDEDEEVDPNSIDMFFNDLQKILPKKEAVIVTEVGHEKLRYVSAYAIVITKDDIQTIDLSECAIERASEMLRCKDWETRMDY